VDDEIAISESAARRLMPWFDSHEELERWAIDQLLHAAEEHRFLHEPPEGWHQMPTRHRRRETLRYIETVGPPPDAVLLFDIVPECVTLKAAWSRGVKVRITGHAAERISERIEHLEPDRERRRAWLQATVDRALRNDALTLEAPRWAASVPLRPGLGWTTRKLAGDEVALLIAAPHFEGGSWNVVTALSKSTGISPLGRVLRRWKRGRRLLANRIKYRSAEPVREKAVRPPSLGDVSRPPRRPRRRR
jgi:hypothetical protein